MAHLSTKRRFLFVRLITLLFTALLVKASIPTHSIVAQEVRAQPILRQMARTQPDKLTYVIVQKITQSDHLEKLVAKLGGTVTSHLHIINAFAAKLPARAIPTLAKESEVRWVSLDAQVAKAERDIVLESVTLRSEFDTSSYQASFSTDTWPSPWVELGETNGPEVGDVRIASFQGGMRHGVRIQGANRGIQSTLSLPNAHQASMTITYKQKEFGSEDSVLVNLSTDGGNSWTELARLSGSSGGEIISAIYDISAFTSDQMVIRFSTLFKSESQARFYLDSIQLDPIVANDDHNISHLYLPLISPSLSTSTYSSETANAAGTRQFQLVPSEIGETIQQNVHQIEESSQIIGDLNEEYIARDEFTNSSFSNNDGNVNWLNNWVEVNDGRIGPAEGKVRIDDGEMRLSRFLSWKAPPSAARDVDLSGNIESATLRFDFRTTRGVDTTDKVAIEISSNGGATYIELASIAGLTGAHSGTMALDIANHASAHTTIRFRISDNYHGLNELFYIDNVAVSYFIDDCHSCIDTSTLAGSYVKSVGADRLWNEEISIQGNGVGVAIVDTGIAIHDDLMNELGLSRVISQVQYSSVSGNIDDFYGHGSHVAGVIGGNGAMSGGGHIGIAPKANLIDVKVIDDQGVGSIADVIAGLQWVLEHKDKFNIRIANLSLSSKVAESYLTNPLNAAVETLWFNGIVVVVSAGNTGTGSIYPPANDPFVITVGATDDRGTPDVTDDQLAPYSAHGVTESGFQKPEIVAPGTNLISLLASDDSNLAFANPSHKISGVDGNHYFRMTGTSMAAAVVTGAIALLLEDEPHLTPDQVKHRLLSTATPLVGAPPGSVGTGSLDIYAAVHGSTTASANIGIATSQLLVTDSQSDNWNSINWDSVNWDSVNWDSVIWDE
ncbi:MAG: S8 family peptidase [Chloroflexota bacterium]